MRRLDFFNESKIVAAQASLSPFGKEEVGHFRPITSINLAMKNLGEMGHSARYGMLMFVVCEIKKSKRCN
jgi:hypothetical protein